MKEASDRADGRLPARKAASKKAGAGTTAAVMVKPVANAIRILRYLSQTGAPERAVDIARHLAINPSTCFNILRTLVAEEVVDFNPLSKTYSAGLGLARLVQQLVTQGHQIEMARPALQDLAARYKVTATLWRRMGNDRIVLVASEASPTDLRIDMPRGQRLPIMMGASGRLFAHHLAMEPQELRDAFDEIRWARALSFDNYLREVAKAKRRGYAVDDGHFASGIVSVAAPIVDAHGAITFTVSAVMFRNQHDEAGIEQLGTALVELAAELRTILF